MTGLADVLRRMPTRLLVALHLIAKDPKKGLRPFFAEPQNMIALRIELSKRNDREQ